MPVEALIADMDEELQMKPKLKGVDTRGIAPKGLPPRNPLESVLVVGHAESLAERMKRPSPRS